MRFFVWFVTLIIAIIVAIGFNDLNHDPITLRFTSTSETKTSPTFLILVSIAIGALAVVFLVWARAFRNLIVNWQSSRQRKREEKVESYYAEGTLATLSRRSNEAIELLQKALVLEPNHIRTLVSLGNLYRKEKHYNEAIRLHRKARSLEEGNVEVLLALIRDLDEARRFEEALQVLAEVLKVDSTNPTALYRTRDIYIQSGKWREAHDIQERLRKTVVPDRDKRIETQIMAGLKYEVGRELIERGDREVARRFFKEAIKLDKGFLPARIGFGETLIKEGKLRQAAESWEKSFVKTGNRVFLQRLEDLFLEMGEPGEMIRIYKNALAKHHRDPTLKLALGTLYYRLEMIDDAYDLLSTLDGVEDPTGNLHKMLATIHIRKGNTETALMELQESLNESPSHSMQFECTFCHHHVWEWSGRCSECGRWNTIGVVPAIILAESSYGNVHDTLDLPAYPTVQAPFENV